MLFHPLRRTLLQPSRLCFIRLLTTLPNNPHIYVFPDLNQAHSHLLTLLPTDPPSPALAIGTTTRIPPTSTSLTENPQFLHILHSVIAQHASSDPDVLSQAAALASNSGFSLSRPSSGRKGGGGGASDQGGAGGGGRGGWVHVSDQRHPPDFGRIAEPEDIFGSVEVDAAGHLVDGHGRYQVSGTYRVITREGVLGLSEYLRRQLVERLEVEEANIKNQKPA